MRNAALALAALVFFASLPAAAPPGTRASMLVSPAWLAGHLRDPDLVILQVGPEEGYGHHIPGARFVTLDDLSVSNHSGGNMLELPAAADLRARLARLGISDNSRIVVAFDQDWVTPGTRVVFTLGAAGFAGRVALLDGGVDAWRREGLPLAVVATPQRTGRLSPLQMQPWTADAAFVRAYAGRPGFALIDARASAFYDGVQAGMSQRRGHIPGAVSIPFSSVVDSASRFRPAAELAASFRRAGLRPGDTVIVYCHVGQQATAIVFAARSLGYRALLYDGSFEDWSRRDLPVQARARS